MSSLFETKFGTREKTKNTGGRAMISTRHEGVYHVAQPCQAASLPLTQLSLRGQKKACRIERQKTSSCFVSRNRASAQLYAQCSGSTRSMLSSSLLKNGRLVLLSLEPDRKENSHPDISKCTDGDTVTFPFSTFALIVGHGPWFGLSALPGKLLQGVAQRFDASIAPMRFGIVATFIGDRRGSRQCLQAGRILVTLSIISKFCQQSRGQAFARARQMAEDVAVSVGQKKAFDLLVVGRNLFHHRQELADQCQQQACFRTCSDSISDQMGLMQLLNDLGARLFRLGISGCFQDGCDLLGGSRHRLLRCRESLQEPQRRTLLYFVEKGECDGIVSFEAGGQLINQARLAPDQVVLIACQSFQFGNHWTVWLQSPQICQLRSAVFGQQIGVNLVGFGSRCRTFAIDGFGVDGIDGKASFQQRRNQQTMIGFNDAGHCSLVVRTTYGLKSARQFSQPFGGMCDTKRGELTPALFKDKDVMMGIRPIYSCKPHEQGPPCEKTVPGAASGPFTAALVARLSNA